MTVLEAIFRNVLKCKYGSGYSILLLERNDWAGGYYLRLSRISAPNETLDLLIFYDQFTRSVINNSLDKGVVCNLDNEIENRNFRVGKRARKLH